MKKVLLLGVLFLLLAGCIEEETFYDERVLGSWEETHDLIFTFSKDMKLVTSDGNIPLEYSYWFENGTLVIDWGENEITTYDYEIKTAGGYEFFVLRIDNVDKILMHRLLE